MYTTDIKKQKGQGLIEYGLIIALGTVIILSSLGLFGLNIKDVYRRIWASLMGGSNTINLFTDQFDNTDLWSVLKNDFWHGDWDIEDGKLVGSELASIFLNGFSGTDYAVTVDSVSLSKIHSSWNGFGVFFRTSNVDNLDGYIFEIEKVSSSDPGMIVFRKWENGNQIETPIASTSIPADFDWDNPGDVRIEVEGDTFTAYINDTQVLQATDDTWSEGGVGLAANYGTEFSTDSLSIDTLP